MNQETPANPQEPLIEILKQDNYKLETLNRHIKNENEILKEQIKLKKAMHVDTTLHLGLLHKENKKLKKKNKRLNKAIINLRFKLLMKRPRMTLTSKRNRRIRLDVLAEVSEHV